MHNQVLGLVYLAIIAIVAMRPARGTMSLNKYL